MFHLLYDPKDDTCLIANVDFQRTTIAVYEEISSGRTWNSFKNAALKTFVFDYNITNEHITDILEKENLILLTTQISLKEVQNFIRASPELLI